MRHFLAVLGLLFTPGILSAQKSKSQEFVAFAFNDSVQLNMQTAEVSNLQYRKFLQQLSEADSIEFSPMIVEQDSEFRGNIMTYFNADPFDDYPVVGVTIEGAQAYCKWLDSMDVNPNYSYRLPTASEWRTAAYGGAHQVYPWTGELLMDHEGRTYSNFKVLNQECASGGMNGMPVILQVPTVKNEIAQDFTAPVGSYWPNALGLYNMSGNVAELVADSAWALGGSWKHYGYDVRIDSYETYTGPANHIGFRVLQVERVVPLKVRK